MINFKINEVDESRIIRINKKKLRQSKTQNTPRKIYVLVYDWKSILNIGSTYTY